MSIIETTFNSIT